MRGYVSLERLLDWVRKHPIRNSDRLIPICVWGRAGAAKTQKIKGYCRDNGLGIKVYQPAYDKSAADLVGQKSIDEKTGKTVVRLPDWLPVEGECEPEGILFIDEINRGGEDVLQGLFQPLGEGEIQHIGWKLPRGWIIVCAANPPEGDYKQVKELDQAMVRRMINYIPGWNASDWVYWGEREGQIQDILMDFVFETPHLLDKGEGNLMPETVKPVANARTLEYLSALIEPDMPIEILDVCATGLVGKEAAERILFMFEERKTGVKPLSGKELLLGVRESDGTDVHTLLAYWMTQGIRGDRMIRASTGRAISALYKQPVPPLDQPQRGPHNMWLWLCNLPEETIGPVIADLEETIPDWLEYFRKYGNGEFEKRIPLNRSEITALKEHKLVAEQSHEEAEHDWTKWQQEQAEASRKAAEDERRAQESVDPFAFLDKGMDEEPKDQF
jgi:hypothetical protein